MSMPKYWNTLRQRKISRRTMLGASAKAGVGAAGLALVGCGDDDEPDAGAVAAERAASAAEEAAAAAIAAGDARAAETEAAADAAAEAAAAASEASAAASQAADAADAAAALAAEAAESEDAANAAAAAEAAAAAAAQAADAASAAGDAAAAAVADAAAQAAEAAAQAARDAAAAVEAGTATAEAAQAAIDEAAAAAAAAAEAAGEASAAAGEAAATAQETAEAAAETAAAAVAAAQEAADAAQEAAESAAMAAEDDEAPATGPQHGGMLSMGGIGDGGIFDPAIANHGGTDSIVLPVYDHLNYLDHGGVLTSAMAELPEVVDDLNFVYNIKPNVHWQDKAPLNGRQFVAEDAAFGLQRYGQDNPEFIWRDRFAAVDQFGVPDDLTLHLTLGEPFAPLVTAVGEIQALMVSRDAVEAFGDDGIASNIEAAIGTGGMQMVSREEGVVTVLERNPNYFRDPLPYFDGIQSNWNADGAYRAAQYVAGEFDMLWLPWLGFPAENAAVQAQVGEENLVEVPMNATWNIAIYIHTKVEPYTDPRVRLALHLAANREQLFAVSQGFLEVGGPIGHASGVYAWSVDELRELPGYRSGALREEDLAEGRRLLDASGYDPASVPTMSCSDGETLRAQVLQQNFAEVGFEVDLEEVPDTEHLGRRAAGDFTISTHGQGGEFDPDVLYGKHHSAGGRNFGEFSDPEIDALLEQGRTTLGTENRVPIYDEIQTKLLENPSQIYAVWGRPVVGHRPWLKGYGPTNSSTAATQRLYRSWFEGKPGV